MQSSLVVKNTFICAVGAEALSPVCCGRRRACTDGDALSSFSWRSSADEEESVGSTASCLSVDSGSDMTPVEHVRSADAQGHGTTLMDNLHAGGVRAMEACASLTTSVLELSTDEHGSHLLRLAMEIGGRGTALSFARELVGSVRQVAHSAHACEVLADIVCALGSDEAAFIAQELCVEAQSVATSFPGNALVCRLLEWSAATASTRALVNAALGSNVAALCCHKHGHEVAMSILSNGVERQRRAIVAALLSDVQRYARHRFASSVLAQALLLCPADESEALALQLLQQRGAIVDLACHNFGVHVMSALLELPRFRQQGLQEVMKASKRMSRDKFGRTLLQELGLAKPAAA